MASLITCTPGGHSDNCYITLANATLYFASTSRADTWAAYSTDEREEALIRATQLLEELGGDRADAVSPARTKFSGSPYTASGATAQALHFPRTTDLDADGSTKIIPRDVREAVCEQAYWMLTTTPEVLDFDTLQGKGVSSLSVDGVAVSMTYSDVPMDIAPRAWAKMRAYVRRSYGTA